MANIEHLTILQRGVETWNEWRQANPQMRPDLTGATILGPDLSSILPDQVLSDNTAIISPSRNWNDFNGAILFEVNLKGGLLSNAVFSKAILSKADLTGADLRGADLSRADLSGAFLNNADLREANLSRADLSGADLSGATLKDAILIETLFTGADLSEASFIDANLCGASFKDAICNNTDFTKADLQFATFVRTALQGAILSECAIFGASVWGVKLDNATQISLRITPNDEPAITVDNLRVAQFIYLILNNKEISKVIDTVGQKAVLILGRFSEGRKEVLDAIAEGLRQRDYLPIIFDFDKPQERDFTETVMTLAGLSLFIIADLTSPRSNPLELQATVPNYGIPVVTIIQEGEDPFAMFRDLKNKYNWVIGPSAYDTKETVVENLDDFIIKPAQEKHKELLAKKAMPVSVKKMKKKSN